MPPQRKDAVAAHVASQRVEQQKGSLAQTEVQQVAESQPGFAWADVHGPLAVAPQYPTQSAFAVLTQSESQAPVQQDGSNSQTCAQHVALLHPGVA